MRHNIKVIMFINRTIVWHNSNEMCIRDRALGMSRISDNGKIIIRLAGTSDTQGKVGVAVGAGYHLSLIHI